jgi:hypothetical protein
MVLEHWAQVNLNNPNTITQLITDMINSLLGKNIFSNSECRITVNFLWVGTLSVGILSLRIQSSCYSE